MMGGVMDEWPERWESFGGSTCTWLAWVKRTNQMDRDGCAVTRSAGTYLLLVYPFKGTLSFARLSTSYLGREPSMACACFSHKTYATSTYTRGIIMRLGVKQQLDKTDSLDTRLNPVLQADCEFH